MKKKSNKNSSSISPKAIIAVSLLWLTVGEVLLAMNKADSLVVVWVIVFGSFLLAVGICQKLANGYRWLPLFVIAGTALISILAYMIYAFVYLFFNKLQ